MSVNLLISGLARNLHCPSQGIYHISSGSILIQGFETCVNGKFFLFNFDRIKTVL